MQSQYLFRFTVRIICIDLIQNELVHVIRNKMCIGQEEWLNSSNNYFRTNDRDLISLMH